MSAITKALLKIGHWLIAPNSSKPRRRHRFRPRLEVLEGRITPANFTWKAAAAGAWENAANWDNPDGDAVGFPNDATDTAKFDGQRSNQNATLSVNDLTIGRLDVLNGFTSEIRLSKSLTIKDGTGEFESNLKLAPQNNTSNLIVDNSLLLVRRGTLGSTTFSSEIRVINSGLAGGITFNLSAGVQLGMKLVIGTALGGGGKGSVSVRDNTAGFDGVHVTVTNNANITVNKDSSLYLSGKDNDAWILREGLTSGYIQVQGEVFRSGSGETKVQLPFLVLSGGQITMSGATLNIDSPGVTASIDASLYVHTGGSVVFAANATEPVPILRIADEAIFNGGALTTITAIAQVQAINLVEFRGASTMELEGVGYGEIIFDLLGPNGKVILSGGTWTVDLQGGTANSDYIDVIGGKLEIDNFGTTTLKTRVQGAPVAGQHYVVIDAPEIVGDFAAIDQPVGVDISPLQFFVGGREVYRLTVSGQWGECVENFSSEFNPSPGDYSAAQALDKPNTFSYGDNPTAWSSASFNNSNEFITICFENSVYARGVSIWETNGNGFVYQVDLLDVNNVLHQVWTGTDPSQPGSPAEFTILFSATNYLVRGVKIYVNTNHNQNTWEQIDAVMLYGDAVGGGGLSPMSGPTAPAGVVSIIEVSSARRDNVGPFATLAVVGPVALRAPVTFQFSSPTGGTGFRYSFDFNNDGDFSDPGEVRDGLSPSAQHRFTTRGWKVVRGRILSADGRFTDFWVRVFVP